jgi:vitamin B12 transporter
MSKQSILSLSILFALAVRPALAADDAALQPTVEVTARRVAETVDAALADVSIITRSDIDASNAPDLLDLLRLQAGVDLYRTGGAGEQTSVFVRGTNTNHVLVLIDGVRVASANTGAFAFENLPLDAVERIEIVRGPRASYWGSDAIGGVIQIFTRRLDGMHLAASFGSYRSADGSVGFGARNDDGAFSVQVGARHVGGFSATNPGICNGPNDPYCIYNADDNGLQNHSFVAQGNYRLGSQQLSATVFRSEGTQNFDNGSAGDGISHTLDQALGVNLEGTVSPAWTQRLSVGTSREDVATPAFLDAFRSTREQLAWTNAFTLSPAQQIVAGADFNHDRGVSEDFSGFGAPYDVSRDNSGVFAGWRVHDGAADGELSGRYDHNSQFGSAFSGSIAGGYRIAEALRVTASYGTAFRAPNSNELYSPGYGGYFAGNPLLDPERSRSGEIGLAWQIDRGNSLDAHAFSTRVHDLVDFSGGSTSRAINIDHAAIDGLELTHAWRDARWSWTNALTVQDARNADAGTQLVRRPRDKFSSVFEAPVGDAASAGVELAWSGKRDDVGGVVLGSYALVNLRANYTLGPSWRIGARLENLLDRDYVLVHGYNTPGRSGYLTLTFEPHG